MLVRRGRSIVIVGCGCWLRGLHLNAEEGVDESERYEESKCEEKNLQFSRRHSELLLVC
jgi:hypothetical protein